MKNFILKFSGAFLVLISLFLIGNYTNAQTFESILFNHSEKVGDTTDYISLSRYLGHVSMKQELNLDNCKNITENNTCLLTYAELDNSYFVKVHSGQTIVPWHFSIYEYNPSDQISDTGTIVHGSSVTYSIDATSYPVGSTEYPQNAIFEFSDILELDLNKHYYFTLGSDSQRTADTMMIYGDENSELEAWFSDTGDTISNAYISFYGLNDYAVSPTQYEYWNILDSPYPDYTSNYNPVCFVGSDCNIWIQINDKMINSTFTLVDTYAGTFIASTSVNFQYVEEVVVSIPYTTQTASSTQDFDINSDICFAYEIAGVDFSGCGISKSGFSAYWTTEEDYFPDMSFLDDPCHDVATSSGSYADDFRYGIQCGFQQSLVWLFRPSTNTMIRFENSFDSIKQDFPINIITRLSNTFSDTYASSSDTQLLPVLDQDGQIFNYVIDEQRVINSNNYYIVEELNKVFRIVVYFLLGLYIIRRIISFTKQE